MPVGARDGAELEGVGPDLAGGGDVGAAAEVKEAVLLVGRDSALECLDELDLEGLIREEPLSLFLGDFLADEFRARGDDAAHLLLDGGEVLLGDGLRQLEVVVEAVLYGGADAELGARVELQDCLGKDVRGRVADGFDGGGHRSPLLEKSDKRRGPRQVRPERERPAADELSLAVGPAFS